MRKRPHGKRKSGNGTTPSPHRREPEESRAVEFFTIAWMLAVFTTLVCELSTVGATWYLQAHSQATSISVLASVLMFASLVIGLLSLALMAVVWQIRTVRPPIGISVFALVVGVAPG